MEFRNYKLFSRYCPSNGKTPMMAIKDNPSLPTSPEGIVGDFVGILRDDIVQLDFDNKESADLILKIVKDKGLRCDIMSTRKGIHLYFKSDKRFIERQGAGIFNFIGTEFDLGIGSKCRAVQLRDSNHEPSAMGGFNREWIQIVDNLDVIPPYFAPNYSQKTSPRFEDCTQRNTTLYAYILSLSDHKFTHDEARACLKVINDYVFNEKLPDSELNTITRPEAFAFDEVFFDGNNFLHADFGDHLIEANNIVSIDDRVYIQNDEGDHVADRIYFDKACVKAIRTLKMRQRNEVYGYITSTQLREVHFSDKRYLKFKNGVLDIEEMLMVRDTENLIIPTKIPHNYRSDAYYEITDKMLDKVCCHDKKLRGLIEEMMGYSLYRSGMYQKCFILEGGGGNGKSVILDMIKQLVGLHGYSALAMQDLEEKFKPAELEHKTANIGDDISAKYMTNTSVFKKAVTGESMTVERKGQDPFTLQPYATQIFATNEMPKSNDKTDGFSRRIIIVPFNARFKSSDADYDPRISEKVLSPESMDYITKLAVDGLKRLVERGKFDIPSVCVQAMDTYNREMNPIIEWLEEEGEFIEHHSLGEVKMKYDQWCISNHITPLGKINLSKAIGKHTDLHLGMPKKVDGSTVKVFERINSSLN